MNKNEFSALVEAYGAKSDNWPIERRDAAWTFIHDHPELAKELSGDALELDGWLDQSVSPAPSELLSLRILKEMEESQPVRRRWNLRNIAASLVVMSVVGIGLGSYVSQSGDIADAESWSQAADDLGMSEIYLWVEGDIDDTTSG